MIQVYKDGELSFDSRLQHRKDMRLLALTAEDGLNKGGVALLTMDREHKDFDRFVSHKSIVEIWKNGRLDFRGRAEYPEDDFYHCRTITCEGEKCFLRDVPIRPFLYQEPPAEIFTNLINEYNRQATTERQFKVGTITVTHPNHYVPLSSDTAVPALDAIDQLIKLCGGVLVFSTNDAGERTINWLSEANFANNQIIEFGSNLLDYARTDDNPDLVTAILPYGAEMEIYMGEDVEPVKERLTIASVNGGVDYIQDDAAVALRGFICKPVYYNDITDPSILKQTATKDLNNGKLIISTLELTAADLADLDKSIDSFKKGDRIKVTSKPHGVDEYFTLTDRKTDYLNPGGDKIILGKSKQTMTGSSAANYKENADAIQKVTVAVKDNANKQTAALGETKKQLLSLIQQTATSILLQVGQEYVTNEVLTSSVSTSLEQLSNSFNFEFNRLEEVINANGEQIEESKKYIRFVDGTILIGEEGNELTLQISNDRISFMQNGGEVAYFSNNKLFVTDGEFLNSLTLGRYAFIPRDNGNLSFRKIKVN